MLEFFCKTYKNSLTNYSPIKIL